MDAGFEPPRSSGPKTRTCYICGRGYGLSSYEIHLKQCKELFIAREAQKDPRERKKLPPDPSLTMTGTGGNPSAATTLTRKELDELNKTAGDTYNTESLSTCAFCGRTFLPEKLVIHNRSCTIDTPARRVGTKAPTADNTPQVTPQKPTTSTGKRPQRARAAESMDSPGGSAHLNQTSSSAMTADTMNLKIENGGFVPGSTGKRSSGSSPLDFTSTLKFDATATGGLKGASEMGSGRSLTSGAGSDNTELVQYLTGRLETLEGTAKQLVLAIAEMKVFLAQLQK